MKRGCVAFVLAMIAFALILVMFYQCTKWSASPAVLTPRAATAGAVDPVWWTPTPSKNRGGQTPGLMATWDKEQAEALETVFAQVAATSTARKAERIATVCAEFTRSPVCATLTAE